MTNEDTGEEIRVNKKTDGQLYVSQDATFPNHSLVQYL